jgi:NAD(P)-dependent dehydrogenase (short-subunit alcohol dehydrogenase family)
VIAADVDLGAAVETAKRGGASARIYPIHCDVTSSEAVQELATYAEAKLGGVDLLINNAGVALGGPVGVVPLVDWQWIMSVNLWGPIHGCHHFVPLFRRQGSGHILNVASAAGLLSAPEMAAYNVTKAGVVALSETLRAELSQANIGVTVLCPTFFRTSIAASGRLYVDSGRELVELLMDRATITADGVARAGLDGCAVGRLYVLPQQDGAWLWRLKRAAPAMFHGRLSGPLVLLGQHIASADGLIPKLRSLSERVLRGRREAGPRA